MNIVVFGLGYVGFTQACCLVSQGHHVVGVDLSGEKVAKVMSGEPPIVEPGLREMLVYGLREGRFRAVTAVGDELADCDIAVVCVGTPSSVDGSHDMRYIARVTQDIAENLAKQGEASRKQPLVVVFRSTFRPGTIEELVTPIFETVLGAGGMGRVQLVYNPEFLREATAVADYFAPPKIVVGTRDGKGSALVEALYADIEAPFFDVPFRVAEATKFIDNTWHAVKVAFANEVGRICIGTDIDADQVHEIFISDTKLNISAHYLRPGGPFGGSCLPKDVRALQRIAADKGVSTQLIDSLLRSNDAHKHCMFERASAELQRGECVLLVGLAFKAGTDDLRESPNVDLARMMLDHGFDVSIYDPAIEPEMLQGANLGYVSARLGHLDSMLLTREAAERGTFSRTIVCNATANTLDLSGHSVVTLSAI